MPFLQRGFADTCIHCLVAAHAGTLVGVAVAQPSTVEQYPRDGELVSLYLQKHFVGAGIGHRLLTATEDILRGVGLSHCVLDVLSENRRAINSYVNHGFTDTGHRQPVEMGGKALTCLVMRKPL